MHQHKTLSHKLNNKKPQIKEEERFYPITYIYKLYVQVVVQLSWLPLISTQSDQNGKNMHQYLQSTEVVCGGLFSVNKVLICRQQSKYNSEQSQNKICPWVVGEMRPLWIHLIYPWPILFCITCTFHLVTVTKLQISIILLLQLASFLFQRA